MSKVSDEINSIFAMIDSFLTTIEQTPNFKEEGNYNISFSPMQLLFELLRKFVTLEQIQEFLLKTLTTSLPYIEMGVKGVLLSQLKATIDCVNDPRIPYYIREKGPNDGVIDSERTCRGIFVDVNAIDYKGIFSVSPLEKNQLYYFGTSKFYSVDIEKSTNSLLAKAKYNTFVDAFTTSCLFGGGINNVVSHGVQTMYELARAEDMNAFLWYVIQKSKSRTSILLTEEGYVKSYFDGINDTSITVDVLDSGDTSNNLGVIKFNYNASDNFIPITEGTLFNMGNISKDNEYNFSHYSICIDKLDIYQTEKEKKTFDSLNFDIDNPIPKIKVVDTTYTIVPYSYNNHSVNWYARRHNIAEIMPFDMLDKLSNVENNVLGTNTLAKAKERSLEGRKLNEEFAILNFQYLSNSKVSNVLREQLCDYNKNQYQYGSKFWIKVLPKPYIKTVPIKKTLEIEEKKISVPLAIPVICLFDKDGNPDSKGCFSVKSGEYVEFDEKTGKYTLKKGEKDELENILYECYPKLTVYELNYDLVMGMKLFDPEVVTRDLMEIVIGVSNWAKKRSIGLNIKRGVKETEYQMRISSIIERMINQSDDSTISDCFFTFSNEKYEELERKAELKRASLQSFDGGEETFAEIDSSEALDILSEYNRNGNLQENIEVLSRTIESATYAVTKELLPEDRYSMKFNLITDMLKGFITSIVETLFSPKILMLLEINKQLVMTEAWSVKIEDIIEGMFGMITSIVEEIIDMVLQYMLKWLLEKASELFQKAAREIALEQINYYTRVIRKIIRNCTFRPKHRKDLDTQLDDIEHAEITATDKPITKEC